MDMGGLLLGCTPVLGAYLDLGASPRADWYEVVLKVDGYQAGPALGEYVEVWFTQSNDGTNFDGQPTTAPTATTQGTITFPHFRNCTKCLSVKTYSTSATQVLRARALVQLTGRYIAPIVCNHSLTRNLKSVGDAHTLTLRPIVQEGQ